MAVLLQLYIISIEFVAVHIYNLRLAYLEIACSGAKQTKTFI